MVEFVVFIFIMLLLMTGLIILMVKYPPQARPGHEQTYGRCQKCGSVCSGVNFCDGCDW